MKRSQRILLFAVSLVVIFAVGTTAGQADPSPAPEAQTNEGWVNGHLPSYVLDVYQQQYPALTPAEIEDRVRAQDDRAEYMDRIAGDVAFSGVNYDFARNELTHFTTDPHGTVERFAGQAPTDIRLVVERAPYTAKHLDEMATLVTEVLPPEAIISISTDPAGGVVLVRVSPDHAARAEQVWAGYAHSNGGPVVAFAVDTSDFDSWRPAV